MAIEVYTPGGNWSSYPPHKHDVHNPPGEVDLDEIYYYRIRQPEGFAFQHLYAGQHAGEQTLKPRDGDTVLVHSGFHPVVAGPGYDVYYLNFLAGSSRALAVTEDPKHVWIRGDVEGNGSSFAAREGISSHAEKNEAMGKFTGAGTSESGMKAGIRKWRAGFSPAPGAWFASL